MARLDGEVAVVSGSTSGLGKAIAARLAAEGAAVVVTGRSKERGDAVVEALTAAGGRARFVAADLSDEEQAATPVKEAVAAFGRLTVLVNNAVGGRDAGPDGSAGEVTTEAWERILRVDLTAALWLCRAALPHLAAAGGGSIVNVSSRVASHGTPGLAAYTAAKGALEALTRSIAVDYAAQGIRCNAVRPGYVLHEQRDADLDGERRARLEGMQLTRLATADDVAAAVAYLVGPDSGAVTGVVLPVDGGSTSARALTLG